VFPPLNKTKTAVPCATFSVLKNSWDVSEHLEEGGERERAGFACERSTFFYEGVSAG